MKKIMTLAIALTVLASPMAISTVRADETVGHKMDKAADSTASAADHTLSDAKTAGKKGKRHMKKHIRDAKGDGNMAKDAGDKMSDVKDDAQNSAHKATH